MVASFQRRILLLFCLALSVAAIAIRAEAPVDGPPYRVTLKSDASLALVPVPGSSDTLSFDVLSDAGKKVLDHPTSRHVVAAGYDTGVVITTKDPAGAAQDILSQIAMDTGLRLRWSIDSRMNAIAPTVMVQGFSDTAVVTILLTPMVKERFAVSCAYMIDARPAGSSDGTPAGVEKMRADAQELRRWMDGDSIADTLPTHISETDAGKDEFGRLYFRSPGKTSEMIQGKQVPVLLLMLKRQATYTIGFYTEHDREWKLLASPIVLTGTKAPYYSNIPNRTQSGLRANKLDGHGSTYIYLENGSVIRRDL